MDSITITLPAGTYLIGGEITTLPEVELNITDVEREMAQAIRYEIDQEITEMADNPKKKMSDLDMWLERIGYGRD
jgi:hypothetical protein